jgi:sec-independent protein translocase protein TatB
MFDVGFWELTVLMTLALLVLGPDKLPGLVTGLGRWLGRARAMARSLRVQIEREMADTPASPAAGSRPAAGAAEAAPSSSRNGEAADEPGSRF